MIEAVAAAGKAASSGRMLHPNTENSTSDASPAMAHDRFVFSPPPQPSYDYLPNNQVNIYFDAPAIYPAMDQLIATAQHSIKMDFFILGGSQAMQLAETLARKVAAGVKVQVIVDPSLGALPTLHKQGKELVAYLKAHGIEVLTADLTDLPPLLHKKEPFAIDHNKMIIVDDSRALIGGMNLANEFTTFHDVMVRVDGPAAGDLSRQLDYDWYFDAHPAEQPHLEALAVKGIPASQPGLATVRVNSTGINRQNQEAAILENIQRATQSIDVAMLELGDDALIDALIVARNRGVKIRVLVDPGDFDKLVPVIHKAPHGVVNAHGIQRLLQAGIDVHTFHTTDQQTILHEKAAIIDGNTLMVGSTNWTTKALRYNSETSVEIHGSAVPAQAAAQFDRDWQTQSDPAQLPALWKRAASWVYNNYL